MNIFIAGTGTNVGKTIVSAIFAEALQADYWKPVQAGNLENTDSDILRELLSNTSSFVHPEAYRFSAAVSPHQAAAMEEIRIDVEKMEVPETKNQLVIEGAGGLMVPLNRKELVIDLILQLNVPVILIVKIIWEP